MTDPGSGRLPGVDRRELGPPGGAYLPATPDSNSEGQAFLAATKRQLSEEQRQRTANRVAELFKETQLRKRQLKPVRDLPPPASREEYYAERYGSSSAPHPTAVRKRSKFYAVRKGRSICI